LHHERGQADRFFLIVLSQLRQLRVQVIGIMRQAGSTVDQILSDFTTTVIVYLAHRLGGLTQLGAHEFAGANLAGVEVNPAQGLTDLGRGGIERIIAGDDRIALTLGPGQFLFELATRFDLLSPERWQAFAYLLFVLDRAVESHFLQEKAKGIWEGCLLNPNDESNPTGDIFHMKEGYLVSSVYNCLNLHLPDLLMQIIRELNVLSSHEELILIEELKPFMINELKIIYEQSRRAEAKEALSITGEDISPAADQNCFSSVLKQIPARPLFHLKKFLFAEIIRKKCGN
jgi:hypothetical protein